jgi:hypothetical protein
MLENNRTDANEKLKEFVDYFKELNNDLRIRKRQYTFKGLAIEINNNSATDFRTNFI